VTIDPREFRRRRLVRLVAAGIKPASAVYLAELEAAGALVVPLRTLAELINVPKWEGRTVYLARTGRQLVWTAGVWELDPSPTPPPHS